MTEVTPISDKRRDRESFSDRLCDRLCGLLYLVMLFLALAAIWTLGEATSLESKAEIALPPIELATEQYRLSE